MGDMIDGCVFHEWPSVGALLPYMDSGWREALGRPFTFVRSPHLYPNPWGSKDPSAVPAHGPAGSDLNLLQTQLLDRGDDMRVVLGYDEGLRSTVLPNYHIARVVVQAANDWTAEQWLSRDDRLHGLILVSSALPEAAAAEIARVGTNDRFVGVALGGNALSRPFGNPAYYPIYEAAVELGLPVVLQVDSDAAGDMVASPTLGGLPAMTGEYRALAWHSQMTHIVSMIVSGVFDIYPELRVLLVGGGAVWIPGTLWRANYWHRVIEREAISLKRLPGDYFLDHFRISTYGLERPPSADLLVSALTTVPGMENALIYTSCYPNDDWQDARDVAARLPEAWHQSVFHDAADALFRWPARSNAPKGADQSTTALKD